MFPDKAGHGCGGWQATTQPNAPAYGSAPGSRLSRRCALLNGSAGPGTGRTGPSRHPASCLRPGTGAARAPRRRHRCPDRTMTHPVPGERRGYLKAQGKAEMEGVLRDGQPGRGGLRLELLREARPALSSE